MCRESLCLPVCVCVCVCISLVQFKWNFLYNLNIGKARHFSPKIWDEIEFLGELFLQPTTSYYIRNSKITSNKSRNNHYRKFKSISAILIITGFLEFVFAYPKNETILNYGTLYDIFIHKTANIPPR